MKLEGRNVPTVDSPVEYALYALATQHPTLFDAAERFFGHMLANDQQALARVKSLLAAQDMLIEHRQPGA